MRKLTAQEQRLVTDALDEFSVLARTMARRLRGVTADDLIGAIHLELMQAVVGYVPTKGTSFKGYAYRGVVGAMLDCAAKERKSAAWAVAASFLRSPVSEEPREEEESIEMTLEPARPAAEGVAQRQRARAATIAARLVLSYPEEGGEDETIERLDRRRALTVVEQVKATLSEDEQHVLQMLYAEGRTLSQVGERLGIHQRTVQRLHERVRDKLGRGLHAAGMRAAQQEHA